MAKEHGVADSLLKRISEKYNKEQYERLNKVVSFAFYLDMVIKNPNLAMLSHERIYRMIMSYGQETYELNGEKKVRYKLFKDKLFGIDDSLRELVDYFRAGAERLDTRKRILLLLGPVSGAKSTVVSIMKEGLHEFSKTDDGELYAIAWPQEDGTLKFCDNLDDPLKFLPDDERDYFYETHGVYVEGFPCPQCRKQYKRLEEKHRGDVLAVYKEIKCKRVILSEADRQGIGTFSPADSKCVTGDTVVLTDSGMRTMEDIYLTLKEKPVADAYVPFETTVLGVNGPEKTSKFYCGGLQQVFEVETNLGYRIKGTANHPLMTMRSGGELTWKKIGELRPGNYVALMRNSQIFGESAKLRESFYPIPQQPKVMTPQLAKWLGYLISEGSVCYYDTWFSNQSMRLIDDYVSLTEKLFGLEAVPHRKGETYNYNVSISSRALSAWLQDELGIKRLSGNKQIPDCVLASSKNDILGFLESLFWGDGTIKGKGTTNLFSYKSKSSQLASQVHSVLLNLGIVSSLYPEVIDGETYWDVIVRGDMVLDLIDLIPSLREKATAPIVDRKTGKTNWDHLPHGTSLVEKHDGDDYLARIMVGDRQLTYNRAKKILAEQRDCAHPSLQDLVDKNYLWVEIREIKKLGMEPVYDFVVPETHSFVANGFIQHNSQDMAELYGGINFKALPTVGSESDPDGWKFDGELNRSNRGLVEFIEMLKADERFLHILLTLAQERMIKTPRFPLLSADEVVIGHTNYAEYNKFVADPQREALKDRMIKVDFLYNLIMSEEEKIYDRLLKEEAKENKKHRAPNALKVAALFGVLTRMEAWEKGDVIVKAKLYDGQTVAGFKEKDIKEMKEASKSDGINGVSPRLVLNVLSEAVTMEDVKCLSPFVVMRHLSTTLRKHKFPNIDAKKQEEYLDLIEIVRKEYIELAKKDVLKAFLESYGPAMEDMCSNYIDHIQAFIDKRKLKDLVTGEDIEPDELTMRSIEDKIEQISDNRREQFRSSMLASIGSILRKGEKFTYRSDERLRKAIEKKIFEDNKSNIRFMTFSNSKTDDQNLKKLEAIKDRMINEHGYCEYCARDVMNFMGGLLAKGDVIV